MYLLNVTCNRFSVIIHSKPSRPCTLARNVEAETELRDRPSATCSLTRDCSLGKNPQKLHGDVIFGSWKIGLRLSWLYVWQSLWRKKQRWINWVGREFNYCNWTFRLLIDGSKIRLQSYSWRSNEYFLLVNHNSGGYGADCLNVSCHKIIANTEVQNSKSTVKEAYARSLKLTALPKVLIQH